MVPVPNDFGMRGFPPRVTLGHMHLAAFVDDVVAVDQHLTLRTMGDPADHRRALAAALPAAPITVETGEPNGPARL